MKLISEEVLDAQYIVEENEGKKEYKIRGIFLQSDIKNRNGRIYENAVLSKEVDRYNREFIQKGRAFGELGHPDGPTVNLERVSHMIKALTPEGKNFIGEAKIMDTPYGKIVKNLIDEGATLGVSSRGMGSIKQTKQGIMEVQKDFMLATAGDIVADPSAPDAFVKGIMEGSEWFYDIASGNWMREQVVEQVVAETKKLSPRKLEEQKFKLFAKFLNNISK